MSNALRAQQLGFVRLQRDFVFPTQPGRADHLNQHHQLGLLEPEGQRRVSLRSLVAPQLGVPAFDAAMDAAEAAEAACDARSS